jgi:hypothetical protein
MRRETATRDLAPMLAAATATEVRPVRVASSALRAPSPSPLATPLDL